MNYKDAIELLTSQGKFHIKLGLERVQAVLNLLENPQDKIKIIHIAGTNGKGSVSSILANILKCANYKVGLYTSPHLVEYTERIKINNNEISQDDFGKYIEEVCKIADKNQIHLTEFEILTVVAYKYFYENKVDIAIIETGLGGRFDATNVCKNTFASIITSISLDHIDRLGDTIDKIAFEKAGIIKEKSNIITSISNKGFNVIKNVAENKNTKLITVQNPIEMIYENETNYAIINNKKYKFPLLGLYQKENLALVLEAIKLLNIKDKAIEEGLKTANWSARLEFIKEKNILIDGAHNPDAALELKKCIDFYFKNKKRIFIYGTLNTKDYKQIANILFNKNDEIYYYEFKSPNAISYAEYKKSFTNLNIKEYKEEVLKKEELKIITGSLYMIGELYNKLKG